LAAIEICAALEIVVVGQKSRMLDWKIPLSVPRLVERVFDGTVVCAFRQRVSSARFVSAFCQRVLSTRFVVNELSTGWSALRRVAFLLARCRLQQPRIRHPSTTAKEPPA
jgi:hypothetical protein